MKQYLTGFYYSLPIQLLLLHLRRYQVFLIFWYILFATVSGEFMKTFGAGSLYLAPEYLGEVNAVSAAIVGVSISIFIMSWNITTFILHSRQIKFLATTAQPFLKYCINNAILPLLFLFTYLFQAIDYGLHQELLSGVAIAALIGGFLLGFLLSVLLAFAYFFRADKTIYRGLATVMDAEHRRYERKKNKSTPIRKKGMIRVDWFFSALLKLRKPRDVQHYSNEFLDTVFKRHHIAAVISIFIAFLFLVVLGYFLDYKVFQIPAAASITIFFAVFIAAAGAFAHFLKSWSVPVALAIYVIANWLYQNNIIDPRNKAYGLDYTAKEERPAYNRDHILAMASPENMAADKERLIKTMNAWKAKQDSDKPILYLINTSGGGTRSAAFTMNVLQRLDSAMGGKLMDKTFLISGASGGMLGAAYFRALYREKLHQPNIQLQDKQYINNISKDLLNPLFSSFVARDLMAPVQKFSYGGFEYIKDRGYAFEQKLNENTGGILNVKLKDYAAEEQAAIIPMLLFNSVISRDGRKLVISSSPLRCLMKAPSNQSNITPADPDVVDYFSLFANRQPENLRVLSALRMNATFPYALPNVWLPTAPVVDVMDAGLRDNFGQESALRFTEVCKDWIKANCSKVVLIQIRDRKLGDWDRPYESKNLISLITKPFLLLQNNWYKLQDYYQNDQLAYAEDAYADNLYRVCFQYVPARKDAMASLSFHLTTAEKKDIAAALYNDTNEQMLQQLLRLGTPLPSGGK
jgi:hypothetical protein